MKFHVGDDVRVRDGHRERSGDRGEVIAIAKDGRFHWVIVQFERPVEYVDYSQRELRKI